MKNPLLLWSRCGLVVLAFALANCAGASFNRDFAAAVAARESGEGAKDPVAGPWTGTWKSHVNGHHGDLRCLVSKSEKNADDIEGEPYDFRYHATWGSWFRGGFSATFGVKEDGRRGYRADGKKDLGPFGSFQHEGWIKDDNFEATYASDMGDHGVFEMKRP